MRPAVRGLLGVWAAFLLLVGLGALLLQWLGPPVPKPGRVARSSPTAPVRVRASPPSASAGVAPRVATALSPPVRTGIAAPDPALLEPAPDFPGRMLPRIGANGDRPSAAYAAKPAVTVHGPQVAILLDGLGLSESISRDAVDTLPAAISLGVSPYTALADQPTPDPLLQQARRIGHETWLCLPMQPASPLDEEGPQALDPASDLGEDRRRLEWALSRLQGYVGVTNALGGLRGDRFVNSLAFSTVIMALAARGLLYLDAGTAPHETLVTLPAGLARHADLTVDDDPDAPDIEARLARLEQIAITQGSALGIAGPLRPVTLDRLRAWSRDLSSRGITLVPVSALPPPHPVPAPRPTASVP